jgi:flagellar motility protein MotE (MotC chaperone)
MNMPRLLPLAAIAVGGVLAIKLISGVADMPALFSGAKAFAEETLGKKGKDAAASPGQSLMPATPTATPAAKPAAVCAPTAAELAKEAGLSPAELQQLQNLGARRDQLDQRETGMDTQLQLLAAAEAKVDAKLKQLTSLKGDITDLLHQVDNQQDVEVNRMVAVYSAMKPKDAAARFVLLNDDVRVPVAAKMKERTLAAILAQMPPADAKTLTEKLALRFSAATLKANAALASQNTPPPTTQAAATPANAPAVTSPAPGAQAAASPAPGAASPTPTKTAAPVRRKPAAKPRVAKAKPAKAPPQMAAKGAGAQDSPAAAAAAAGDTSKPPPAGTPAK